MKHLLLIILLANLPFLSSSTKYDILETHNPAVNNYLNENGGEINIDWSQNKVSFKFCNHASGSFSKPAFNTIDVGPLMQT